MKLDPSSGKVSEHRTRIRTEPLRGCNKLHCVTNGDLYFTDQGESDLQRPDGRISRLTPTISWSVCSIAASAQTSSELMLNAAANSSDQSSLAVSQTEQAVGNIKTVASAATQLSAPIDEIARQVTTSTGVADCAVEEASRTNDTFQDLSEAVQKNRRGREHYYRHCGADQLTCLERDHLGSPGQRCHGCRRGGEEFGDANRNSDRGYPNPE